MAQKPIKPSSQEKLGSTPMKDAWSKCSSLGLLGRLSDLLIGHEPYVEYFPVDLDLDHTTIRLASPSLGTWVSST